MDKQSLAAQRKPHVTRIVNDVQSRGSRPVKGFFDDICLEKYPCGHRSIGVELEDGRKIDFACDGMTFALALKELGVPIPEHFACYLQ